MEAHPGASSGDPNRTALELRYIRQHGQWLKKVADWETNKATEDRYVRNRAIRVEIYETAIDEAVVQKYEPVIAEAIAKVQGTTKVHVPIVLTDGIKRDIWARKGRGRCESCGRAPGSPRDLHTDHDHRTGSFRGVLCRDCNLALGLLQDDPEKIMALFRYLTGTLQLTD